MNAAMSKDDDFEYSFGGRFLAPLWRLLSRFAVHVDYNLTEKWLRTPGVLLVLDLDNSTFSGIEFGKPISAISFLGPCAEFQRYIGHCYDVNGRSLGKPQKSYGLEYHGDGIGFGADENMMFDTVGICLQPNPDSANSKAYEGTVIWNGQPVDRVDLESVNSLVRLFGSPDIDREEPAHDDPEIGRVTYRRYLKYEKPKAMWMIFVNEYGQAQSMHVSRQVKAINQEASS